MKAFLIALILFSGIVVGGSISHTEKRPQTEYFEPLCYVKAVPVVWESKRLKRNPNLKRKENK